MFSVNHNPTREELRKFGWTVLIGLAVIGVLLWMLGGPDDGQVGLTGARIAAIVLWVVGAGAGAVAITAPGPGRYLYVGWMTAAIGMGMVVTPVLFTVLFVAVLPVFALIRLKDPLRLKKSDCPTFWQDAVPHEATLERMMRPF